MAGGAATAVFGVAPAHIDSASALAFAVEIDPAFEFAVGAPHKSAAEVKKAVARAYGH